MVSRGFSKKEVLEMDDEMRMGFCIISQEQTEKLKYNFITNKFESPK